MFELKDITKERMAAALHDLYTVEDLPAISAVAVYRREVIWSASYGYANLEARRNADSDTVYHLGSITKVFTAIMLMQLREAGKLRLEDRLDRYLPELKRIQLPPITLRQLASHTSGLPLMPPMDELAAMMQEFPPSMETLRQMKFPSIKQILADLPRVELLSRPGKQVEYSNLGIALLAHVLERVTGQEYTTYVERQILQPLGMQHSGFSSTVRASVNTAVCYLPFSSPPQAAPFETKIINGFTPTGALWSSVGDMSRLMAFMTGAQDAHPARILSRSALLEMTGMVVPLEHSRYTGTAAPGGVGIGWFLTEVRGQLVAEHGGADPSTAAYIAWVPALDLAAFAATNTGKNPAAVAAAVSTLLEWIIVDIHESRI